MVINLTVHSPFLQGWKLERLAEKPRSHCQLHSQLLGSCLVHSRCSANVSLQESTASDCKGPLPPRACHAANGTRRGWGRRREGRAVGLLAFLRQLPSNCGIRCSHRPGTRPSLFCLPRGGPGVALGRAVSRTSRSPSGHPASIQAEAGRGPPSPRGSRLRHFLPAARRGLPLRTKKILGPE